jgi:ferredoxin-NADP reductase
MIGTSMSVVSYDKGADVIRIAVTPAHTLLKPRPGQYYYIYSPLTWKGWENHPFTLGSYGRPGQVKSRPISVDMNKEISVTAKAIPESPTTSRSSWSESESQQVDSQDLIFWLRPFDGWTRGLRDRCQKSETGIASSRVMIEGPYGHTAHLHNYEHIVFIAGGTGISAMVPYIEEHIHRAQSLRTNGIADSKTSLRTRQIDLIWASRTTAFVHDICAKELRPALSRSDIHTEFFSTSSIHTKSQTKETEEIESNGDAASAVNISINQGRPDITGTILQAARSNIDGGVRAGRLAVLVCGPAGMADEARNAIHTAMREGCDRIEYFEETFGW